MFEMKAEWTESRASYEIGKYAKKAEKHADPMAMVECVYESAVQREIMLDDGSGWVIESEVNDWPAPGYSFIAAEDAWMFWLGYGGDANGKIKAEVSVSEMSSKIFSEDACYEVIDALAEIETETKQAKASRPKLRVIEGGA